MPLIALIKLFKHPFSAVYTSAMFCIQLRLCVYIVCVGQQSVRCVCVTPGSGSGSGWYSAELPKEHNAVQPSVYSAWSAIASLHLKCVQSVILQLITELLWVL